MLPQVGEKEEEEEGEEDEGFLEVLVLPLAYLSLCFYPYGSFFYFSVCLEIFCISAIDHL